MPRLDIKCQRLAVYARARMKKKERKKVFQLWQQAAESREEDGSLTYCAANICIHYFTREFLERVIAEHEHDLVSTALNFSCFVTDTKYATMFAPFNHFQSS